MDTNEFNAVGLYNHNIEAYKAVIEAFKTEDIASIVRATGTGKTYIGLQHAYDNPNKKTTWILPSNGIIEHIQNTIENNPNLDLNRDFPNLEFRTYQSLVNMSREEIEELEIDFLFLDELHHIGAPVWGARVDTVVDTHPNMKVLGMTAYTVRDRGTAYERDMVNPDTEELFAGTVVSDYDLCDAMIDGVLPKPIYRSAYTNLIGLEMELERKVEARYANTKEYETYMAILGDIKKRIHEAPSIADVMKKNIKPNGKYIYFCPPFSQEGVNDIDTIMKEAQGWFDKYLPEENIVFYKSISKDGKVATEHREKFYDDIDLDGNSADGKLRVMFAINQYNEGVHAPGIDGVILGRGTFSDIVYFEQLGRALSVRGDTKEKFEEYEHYSIEELLQMAKKMNIPIKDGALKEEIIQQLIAPTIIDLANNFDFIKELENNLKARIKDVQNSGLGDKRDIKIKDASFDIDIVNQDLFKMLTELREKLIPMSWEDMFNLAEKFYDQYKHLNINLTFKTFNGYDYDENGLNLGAWIATQKQTYRNREIPKEERKSTHKPLTDEQVEKLNSVGMIWSVLDANWDYMFSLVQKNYEHNNGKLNIPYNFKTLNGYDYDETGENLSKWIYSQRTKYKNKAIPKEERKIMHKPLTDEQVEKLNSVGMIWSVLDERWDYVFSLIQKNYEHNNGKLNIPANFKTLNGYDYDETGENLSELLSKLRIKYKERELPKEERKNLILPLTDEQVEKLNSVGMIWSVFDERWDYVFSLIQKNYEYNNGKLNIPYNFKTLNGYDYDETGENLTNWMYLQRTKYKEKESPKEKRKKPISPLTDEQVEKLNLVGMIWDVKKNKEASIELCKQHKLDYKSNPYLVKNVPYQELEFKIQYLLDNNLPLVIENEINQIFFMSGANMKATFGIDREELFSLYSLDLKKESRK